MNNSSRRIFGLAAAGWLCAVVAQAAPPTAPFPTPFNTKDPSLILTPPAESLARIKFPPGFKVSLLEHEPDVQNPIAITTDSRGRLWVAENYTYAEAGVFYDLRLRDRIVVFEDTKHNGHFDKRTVFWDGAQRLTSIEVGFGGVWATCSPQMIFIPDRNDDLVPDGPPEVVLDGWNDLEVQHNIVNGLKWGPDGWLYGRHGIQANSLVGKPGAPDSERIKLNCCIWRYHPTRHVFEVVCQGTTNPWGMDWNEVGEPFFINTIIGHLWEVIPGAHFKRMYGDDFNPHTYELLDQYADHYHWEKGSSSWKDSRGTQGKAGDLGGGHAHVGLMIYQGGNWPAAYSNSLFTVNLHGLRVNNDVLVRSGSGYVGKHAKDFMFFNDPWFRGVEVMGAPDGGAYIADWCDTGECHDEDGVHRTSGRLYKVDYGEGGAPLTTNLADATDLQLVDLQLDKNVWYPRQARLLLQERAAAGHDLGAAHRALLEQFNNQTYSPFKLRAMWALFTSGGTSPEWLLQQLNHADEYVRVWAIRCLTDDGTVSDPAFKEFLRLAQSDPSAMVRLTLTSTLQRLHDERRVKLGQALIAHTEDASDHSLPLMLWYGIEPLAVEQPAAFADMEWQTSIPMLQKFIARRVTEDIMRNAEPINRLLKSALETSSPTRPSEVLQGMSLALRGWRKVPKPDAWDAVSPQLLHSSDESIRTSAQDLGAVFGDGRALSELRRVALDNSLDSNVRRDALQTLIENHPPELLPVVVQLLSNRNLAATAVRGLATFNDPTLAGQLIAHYKTFRAEVRPVVIATLVSRASFARQLLEAVRDHIISARDISAYNARQIHNLGDVDLNQLLTETWGQYHEGGVNTQAKIAAWRAKLIPETLKAANYQHGHELFLKTCGICHRLYGEGAFIGPDLTGAGRADLGYLLENILDPSAVVAADYKASIVELKDDRVLTGIITDKKEHTFSIKTPTETVLVQRDDVVSTKPSPFSMMPDGLIDSMPEKDVADLIDYLTPVAKK